MTSTLAAMVEAHRTGAARPVDTVARCFARIRAHGDPAVFISLRDEGEALSAARALQERDPATLPLYGVPLAVKDNIDVRGLPTTTACPAFAYQPKESATAVARLEAAGAIVVGKTNLDQFATGLVGVRSPYGIPRNPIDPRLIPGGSSSGSAVAVAAGLVPVALGTDTAGSGRVPAMYNNIVGLKPSLGLVSTHGVVPACRTLDCVSVFALTADDAFAVLQTMAGGDPRDPYSRPRNAGALGALPPSLSVGVPPPGQRLFFGDAHAAAAYGRALARLEAIGVRLVETDMEAFYEAARLLYEGPWLAERYAAARALIASSPDSMHPVTRQIIVEGARPSAVEAFTAFYRLEELRRAVEHSFRSLDALALPTAPALYTVAQVLADPILLNARLGAYTNFVNLLDLCGIAVPAELESGRPFGITFLAPAGSDGFLASLARVFHHHTGLALGALGEAQPPLPPHPPLTRPGEIALAAAAGAASDARLRHYGARFLECAAVPDGSTVEIWAVRSEGLGALVAALPAPLMLAPIELADGRMMQGLVRGRAPVTTPAATARA